jgi:hypothetical protein
MATACPWRVGSLYFETTPSRHKIYPKIRDSESSDSIGQHQLDVLKKVRAMS